LVTNIGNTDNSTHGSANDTSWTVNQVVCELNEIKHTKEVKVDTDADAYFYDQALKPKNNLLQKVVKTWRYLKWRFS
jgi:hypothetical protein